VRKIGSLPNSLFAETFRWYLESKGIETKHDIEDEDCDVWVIHDGDMKKAKDFLAVFLAAPSPLPFEHAAMQARKNRKLQAETKSRFKAVDVRTKIFGKNLEGSYITTSFFILLSVCIFILNFFDKERWLYRFMNIGYNPWGGQYWRLVTPIFIHSDFMHIFFNMLWLYQFGRLVEGVKGSFFTFCLIIAIAIPSNLAFFYVAGPSFGGMSGVVYGLAFYMWMVDKIEYPSKFSMDPKLVQFFLVFYVLCWVLSVFGFGVANTVHGVGALMGCVVGLVTTQAWKKNKVGKRARKELLYNVLIGMALLAGGVITDYLTY
jgi:GlpG protein